MARLHWRLPGRGRSWLTVLFLVAVIGLPVESGAAGADPAGATEHQNVTVILRDQLNPAAATGWTRAERQRRLVLELRRHAEASQRGLRGFLAQRLAKGEVAAFTPLWIQNAVLVTASPAVIAELAARPDVAAVAPEMIIAAPDVAQAGAVEPNIDLVNAPALWAMGFTGKGVVVASMDSGVDATHPDLAAQWRGGPNSWYDPYGQHPSTPVDLTGHGTATMGVMVARSGSGSAIGIAPDARWIAVKIFDDRGRASTSAIHLGLQWLLDPDDDPATADAPHVVNNSWTMGAPGCNLEFEAELANLVAAGILPVFAAGNFGPNAATAPSPANNPSAFAVGAIDNSGAIYSASSRGPTTCGGATRTYPDVVAPGVSIYTTERWGQYTRVTGTSFAAPHASGLLALLLDAFPDLTAGQQRDALTGSAIDLGEAGADNWFGAGRIDALAAYNSVAPAPAPTATATATGAPVSTPAPTETPTATLLPTATATPTPTATSLPAATATWTPTTTPLPTAAVAAIFEDGFESGDFSAWSAAVTGGRLAVTAAAALSGGLGMEARVDATAPVYVDDSSPVQEPAYQARFDFAPNSVALPRGVPHDILVGLSEGGATVLRVQIQANARRYYVRGVAATGNGSEQSTGWTTLSNKPHAIEVGWRAATSEGASDGELKIWLDGALAGSLKGLSNGLQRLDEIRLGPASGAATSASGAAYFDSFKSTRGTYIGP